MARHRQYFEILGLDEPPADRKAVKRAYSKMLKLTRPEDDPKGFMALRDAHDQALNILQWQAEEAAWEVQQLEAEAVVASHTETAAPIVDPAPTPESAPGLTYGDMLPAFEPEPAPEPMSETSYAIGPTPNLDAPVTIHEPPAPKAPPLIEDLNAILDDPKHYNDRERWNLLFRKARQLDIDDYVDFEQSLLNVILEFHGFFDIYNPLHKTPEKLPDKFTPSIAASLFKTMSWDQVNKHGYHRAQQIEWLERRMSLRKRGVDPVPIPDSKSNNTGKVWMFLFGFFILIKIIQALAGS